MHGYGGYLQYLMLLLGMKLGVPGLIDSLIPVLRRILLSDSDFYCCDGARSLPVINMQREKVCVTFLRY